MGIGTDAYASYRLLSRALQEKGYETSWSDRGPRVTYTAPSGASWQTHPAHIRYPFNSDTVRQVSVRKGEGYEFASNAGFPVPYTYKVEDEVAEEDMKILLDRFGRLIVKPEDSSLSKGLTTDIVSPDMLKKALKTAKEVSPHVLIQQQVEGQEIRFTVIEGRVEAALLRETARVIGDGVSTMAELIAKENSMRQSLRFEYLSYPQLDEDIIDPVYLNSKEVPEEGQVIELARATMVRGGCSIYNIADSIHPTLTRAVEKMVQQLGAGFIVADVFVRDYTQPAGEDTHWLIEFNTAPVLKLYYACRDGRHFDIVSRLAEAIDNQLAQEKGA